MESIENEELARILKEHPTPIPTCGCGKAVEMDFHCEDCNCWLGNTCKSCHLILDRLDKGELVVHCRKAKYDVLVDRTTKWGNPFFMRNESQREEVIRKYKEWIKTQPELLAALPELKGKVLACWCAPKSCHADILAELANYGIN